LAFDRRVVFLGERRKKHPGYGKGGAKTMTGRGIVKTESGLEAVAIWESAGPGRTHSRCCWMEQKKREVDILRRWQGRRQWARESTEGDDRGGGLIAEEGLLSGGCRPIETSGGNERKE